MPAADRPRALWHKSRSCNSSECVEVAFRDDCVLVRDSKHPEVSLKITQSEWRSFIADPSRWTVAEGADEGAGRSQLVTLSNRSYSS